MVGIKEKINVEISLIESCIQDFKQKGKSMFLSSSFQSHSIPMLHIFSKIDRSIPVYFVDTGFHFPETIVYSEMISNILNTEMKVVSSNISKIDLITNENRFLFTSDPNLCCSLNKVDPIDRICEQYDIWVTGVRKDQSKVRQNFEMIAKGKGDIIRFHPMLNWDTKMINTYINMYNLPPHPLESEGYQSVGCSPCTGKPEYDERSGRWVGMNKTECGLHLGVSKT
jgi:phosphoadenosine phosphosulfate reductase